MALANNGKYVSERHDLATKNAEKSTIGDFNKLLKKQGVIYTAKEIVQMFRESGVNLEWHHSGFFNKQMGKTYFITEKQQTYFIESHKTMEVVKIEAEIEKEYQERQAINTKLFGFYWVFEASYGGRYGKKSYVKRLCWAETNGLHKPKNFTECSEDVYLKNKHLSKTYIGWDVPKIEEFN